MEQLQELKSKYGDNLDISILINELIDLRKRIYELESLIYKKHPELEEGDE